METWSIVVATLLSPLIAIQVSRVIERAKEKQARRYELFETLMMTRAAILDVRRVEALNMITLVYGKRSDRDVKAQWKKYYAHLNTTNIDEAWRRDEVKLYSELLEILAMKNGIDLDAGELQQPAYFPVGHQQLMDDANYLRDMTKRLLDGQIALPVRIVRNDEE